MCVCACVRVCMRVCVHMCVCMCVYVCDVPDLRKQDSLKNKCPPTSNHFSAFRANERTCDQQEDDIHSQISYKKLCLTTVKHSHAHMDENLTGHILTEPIRINTNAC